MKTDNCRKVFMIYLNQFTRSIFIGIAIAISILTLSNPSSAGKKKTPYVCATGSNVVIRDHNFKAIAKMSKSQCIKSFLNNDEPARGEPSQWLKNGRWHYGVEMSNGSQIVGWVTSQFAKIQYR
jgi:hypothetical protein